MITTKQIYYFSFTMVIIFLSTLFYSKNVSIFMYTHLKIASVPQCILRDQNIIIDKTSYSTRCRQ